MISRRTFLRCAPLALYGALAACSSANTQTSAAAPAPTSAASLSTAAPPTAIPATAQPTTLPATALPATAVPTEEPLSATPDPFAQYEQYTIEALRNRSYGQGQIEIVRTLEEAQNFTRYLIAYRSDDLRITGMLNRPRGAGLFPVVILNHGYYALDAYQTGNGSKLAADYLANRGFMAVAPDLRSHAGSDDAVNVFRAGHVIDVLNLIPQAQKLPSAQPGLVGMWGHSNGGAITAKVITISDQLAGAVIYSPASSNITEDYQFRAGRSRARAGQPAGKRTGVIDRLELEFPVTPEQAPDLYQRLSPLPYLHYVQAPVQIHWGSADETVPRPWPADLLAGLQAAGKPVEYFEYAGQPHSFQGAGNQLYLQRIAAFYSAQLAAKA